MTKFYSVIVILVFPVLAFAQSSLWEVGITSRNLSVSKSPIKGSRSQEVKSFKEFTFQDENRGEFLYVSSGPVFGFGIDLAYKSKNSRWEHFIGQYNYWRNYFVFYGGLNEKSGVSHFQDIYEIQPDFGRLGLRKDKQSGPILRTSSFQLGSTYYPRALEAKIKGYTLCFGISSSMNFDNYEKSDAYFDIGDVKHLVLLPYENEFGPTVNTVINVNEISQTSNLGYLAPWTITMNHSVNALLKVTNRLNFRGEFGYRNIWFDYLYPYENMHIEYTVEVEEYRASDDQLLFYYNESKRLPIQFGGFYLSFSVRYLFEVHKISKSTN